MLKLSQTKINILGILLTNPERSFYMREIGKILNCKPGVFQKSINELVKEEILLNEFKANARFFKANLQYPLYKELKNVILKTVGIIGSLKEVLKKIAGIKLAFIYGSYAQEKEHSLSDIDIIIIGKINEDLVVKQLDKLENELKREFNYKIYSNSDFLKYKKSDSFLKNILKDKKIMLVGTENEL